MSDLNEMPGSSMPEDPGIFSELTQLSEDEQRKLSRVLFPDTDTDEIELLGQKRTLRPLPVKYSKQLEVALRPIATRLSKAVQDGMDAGMKAVDENATTSDQDQLNNVPNAELVESLKTVARICATYYKWDDVLRAVEEEELSNSELQELAYRQQEVCGTNDFLLGPLRLIIKTLQIGEIFSLKFQSMLSSPLFAKPLDAASNTSSAPTQMDS